MLTNETLNYDALTAGQLAALQARMHASWLANGDITLASKLLQMNEDEFCAPLNHDWADRCFCSRPPGWKPADSLVCAVKTGA